MNNLSDLWYNIKQYNTSIKEIKKEVEGGIFSGNYDLKHSRFDLKCLFIDRRILKTLNRVSTKKLYLMAKNRWWSLHIYKLIHYNISYRIAKIIVNADFSSETMQSRRKWNNTFKYWKKKMSVCNSTFKKGNLQKCLSENVFFTLILKVTFADIELQVDLYLFFSLSISENMSVTNYFKKWKRKFYRLKNMASNGNSDRHKGGKRGINGK